MANSIIVKVPSDIKKIKSELFFGLTKRQLIGFGAAALMVFPVFTVLKDINTSIATYVSFFIGFPVIFGTLYKKEKLSAETWFKNYIEHKYIYGEKKKFKISKKNKDIAIARGLIREKKSISNTKTNNS